jgi:trk system potassium uptake protein TrkA
MSASTFIVIAGCGRLGSLLCGTLSREGHRVVIIDREESAFGKLSIDFGGVTTVGNAVEFDVLRRVGMENADVLLATTDDDNLNLMVAQIAKTEFDVPLVIARVYDPAREQLYRELGIHTVSPTHLSADAFLDALAAKRDGR